MQAAKEIERLASTDDLLAHIGKQTALAATSLSSWPNEQLSCSELTGFQA
jgi:hypothetical protein